MDLINHPLMILISIELCSHLSGSDCDHLDCGSPPLESFYPHFCETNFRQFSQWCTAHNPQIGRYPPPKEATGWQCIRRLWIIILSDSDHHQKYYTCKINGQCWWPPSQVPKSQEGLKSLKNLKNHASFASFYPLHPNLKLGDVLKVCNYVLG